MGYRNFMRRAMASTLVAVGLGAAALPAWAQDYKLGDLAIDHPWAPESIGPAPTAAAYFSVTNGGTTVDRLVSVSTPAAREAQIHTNLIEDGIARMRQLKAIDVDPGNPVELRPGGLHVMLIGLKAPLKAGSSIPLTLTFEQAGNIEVSVTIEQRRPNMPAAADHHMGH